MAGRIRDEDVVLVRERSRIADVVGEQVSLRNAGGGALKGLCPFHDEKTPSFTVRPQVGYYKCFGCGAGGDVIDFVMKVDHLSFAEAVERLAGRAGITLRYEEGGYTPGRQQGQRTRLVEAHKAAAAFYAEALASSAEAAIGRRFLEERGFDQAAAGRFGVGYAPGGWDALTNHLRGQGFSTEELLVGGLAREGQRGPLDRFRGRLTWPIRDITGDVIGFGARRLHEDDTGPKYLNTPETPLYRKSGVLYGVDLAKKEIARRMQAVVVEGYTDVMACHLAGVGTAVATCGTAFGAEHIKVLRRLLMDQDEFRGEVVFLFDGDEAGQRAALKAFGDDQKFVTQTYVAVEPHGLDPCELRQAEGAEAVRDLVARRVPLFEFALRNVLGRYDLETPEGRAEARRAGMAIVLRIKDVSRRADYARMLAGWIGLPDPNELVLEAGGSVFGSDGRRTRRGPSAPGRDPSDPSLLLEREALKLALQEPDRAGKGFDDLDAAVFLAPAHAAVHAAITTAGGAAGQGGPGWVGRVRDAAPDDEARDLVAALAVEPLQAADAGERYADSVFARLEEVATTRRIAALKARLQRLNPVEAPEDYNRLFGELVALEGHRRALRERGIL